MAVSDWLRPPRYLVVLFLGIALILMATLAWLGWRLFQQDRALEQQRVQVRLEHAADVVAGELQRRLDAIRDQLVRVSTIPAPARPDAAERMVAQFSWDVAVVVVSDDAVAAYPSGRLVYHPATRPVPEPDAGVFAQGEALEFRRSDLPAAARTYDRLARSPDSVLRAGALVRLARTERKAGRLEAALTAYDQLAALGATSVGDLPAELVARHARLRVLGGSSRPNVLHREAAALRSDLSAGRWRLTRAQYEFYKREACRWMSCAQLADSAATAASEALAAGAEWLWSRRGPLSESGRELVWLDGQPVLVVWQRSGEGMAALVGGATHLAEDWIGALEPLLRRQSVKLAFSDVSGNGLTPPVGSVPGLVITRSVADTRQPWTLHVASADPQADFAQLRERRRLMLLGLATLALFVVVGMYGVMRGVSRELDVARLQSDFVAAVSHEFRTPLTSLKQLAELLASGRVTSDDRRARYYGIMERECGRLHRLVEGLLDFGRMEAGAMEFSWARVAPSDLVQSVVAEFQAERGESGCQVELSMDGAVSPIRADAEALGRAVWNLLDNAVKYSPDRTTVWVNVSQHDGRVAIAVRDEGVGIAPAQRDAVFKKFVRGTSSDGQAVKGTGIGLAMVKHIVEAHGGAIHVESEVGRGSTFAILLPVEG
jgi:signal transduction histidine kinase